MFEIYIWSLICMVLISLVAYHIGLEEGKQEEAAKRFEEEA